MTACVCVCVFFRSARSAPVFVTTDTACVMESTSFSTFACPVLKIRTEDGRSTSSPSHHLYSPLFISCMWLPADRHLCFTCGLLFKEAQAWLCEWFCKKKKKRDYFSSNAVERLKKLRSRVSKLQREVVERLVRFWKTHKASDSCVREHRVSQVTLFWWGKLKHPSLLSRLMLPRSLHNDTDKRIWQQRRMNFHVVFPDSKMSFPWVISTDARHLIKIHCLIFSLIPF